MVRYYYDKYNAIANTTYSEPVWGETTNGYTTSFAGYAKGYSWNPANGSFSRSSEVWVSGEGVLNGNVAYNVSGTTLTEYIWTAGTMTANNSRVCNGRIKKSTDAGVNTTYTRGSLVQSNITAEDGVYPTNGRHTDGFWYVRGAVVNQNPVISPLGTVPSGSIEVKPLFNYKVTDPDSNAMTVTESIDGIVINTRTAVASGTQLTFTPTDLAWLRTRINQTVNITITANDGNGGVTTVNYPITRATPAIDMQLKTPFETDVAAHRLLLQLHGEIPIDAVVNVQACNNAFDANPTWENATNLVLSGFPFPFTNKIKTAAKWGVSFKVRVERGNSALPIYIDGIGGAFD